MDWLLQQTMQFPDPTDSDSSIPTSLLETLTTFDTVGKVTTVHVINLKRRPDRLAAFMSQACNEGLMVMKGVVSSLLQNKETKEQSDSKHKDDDETRDLFFAIDGQGRPAEVEVRLARLVGGQHELNNLVATHWRPNDLKPFDVDAPESEDLVLISPSEKACALSHIATWKGVIQSLTARDTKREYPTAESTEPKRQEYQRKCLLQRALESRACAHCASLLLFYS